MVAFSKGPKNPYMIFITKYSLKIFGSKKIIKYVFIGAVFIHVFDSLVAIYLAK